MGSACQSQASATWLVRRGEDWAAAGLRRWRERARWAEVKAGVAGPAGRGWAALGWAREKGKGEVMGRTGLGFGFGLGWVLGLGPG